MTRHLLRLGQSSNNPSTSDDQNRDRTILDSNTARLAERNTYDNTLPNPATVAPPTGVSTSPSGPGLHTLAAPDLGRSTTLNDKPMPAMGVQPSRESAHQEASDVLPPAKSTTRQVPRLAKLTAEDTNLAKAPPSKPHLVPPPHAPTSTASARSHDSQQHHRIPEARLPSDLLHRRDFEVKCIRDRKKHPVNGQTLFSVRWRSTWVPLDAIVKGADHGCSYVEADGAKWSIRKELKSRVRNILEERKVRWTSMWEPLENLANAQEAVASFEMREQQGLDDAQRVRQRVVLTFDESRFPHGILRPQDDHDYAASQRWVACTWPMIRPHGTLDLYPAIYRILMELSSLQPRARANYSGKSYRDFMRQPQVRPLQWSENYLKLGRAFRFGRRKRAALFLQVTGELDISRPCARCLGEKLAPFVGCVRTAANQVSWLGGACANCGTQDSSYCLHHNKGILGRASYNRTSLRGHTGHPREPAIPSGMQRVFEAYGADHEDEADSDDDDSESDSDDEVDDEVVHGNPSPHFHHLETHALAATLRQPSYKHPHAALPSVRAYPSPLSATDPPAEHAARGKLPKISKTRRVASSASPPPAHPTSQLTQDSTDLDEFELQPTKAAGVAAHGCSQHSVDDPWPQVRTIAEILEENARVDEDFEPGSLEQDFMELLWKHETPARSIEDRRPNTREQLERDTETPPAAVQTPMIDAVARGLQEGRRHVEHATRIENHPSATVHGEGQPPARRKRRADSLEPCSKRPSHSLYGHSLKDFSDHATPGPSTRRKKPPACDPPSRTFISILSLEKIEPKSTHQGCVAGQPCNNHGGGHRPRPRDPLVKVYHNTLDSKSRINEEQAEYILSRSNCYWAWVFTWIWKLWCDEKGGIDNQDYSQVELLLDCADKLRGAAWDCCPRGEHMVIEID